MAEYDSGDLTEEIDAFSEKLVDELILDDFFHIVQAEYSDMVQGRALSTGEDQIANFYNMLMNPVDYFSVEDIAHLAKDDHPLKSVCGCWEALARRGAECHPAMAVPVMVDEDYLNLRREHEPIRKGGIAMSDFISWIDTNNTMYKAEAEVDARYVQGVIGALDSAIAGIKGDILSGAFKTNAGTHHVLIRIGQLLDMHNRLTGEDRDMEYLFSDDGEWYRYVAGFIGDPAGIHDGNGAPLHVGDTVINVVDDKPNERMVILSGNGASILSQEWIDRNHAVKGADYESSNIITANINPTCTISRNSCLNEFYQARQRAHPEYDVSRGTKPIHRQR